MNLGPARGSRSPDMTINVINSLSTTTQTIAGGDSLLIGDAGILAVSGPTTSAILVGGSAVTLIIRGSVLSEAAVMETNGNTIFVDIEEGGLLSAQRGVAANADGSVVENHGTITVDGPGVDLSGIGNKLINSGTIRSLGEGPAFAVRLQGASDEVDNTGTISCDGSALYLGGAHARLTNSGLIDGTAYVLAGDAAVVNHGTIQSKGTALAMTAVATGTNTIFNDGTITGATAVDIATSATMLGTLVNAGTIQGNVKFAGGTDTYDGREGRLFGTLMLGGGDDTAFGGAAADGMTGGDGNDQLLGNGGNDVLFGDAGSDSIDAGTGADTVIGGSDADDIEADDGNDLVIGGEGADNLDGGLGIDTLAYLGSAAGVAVNLGTGAAFGGDAQGDEFQGFERLWGSNQGDTLTGSSGANTILGLGGDDVLKGGGGADVLRGGEGNDTLEGGAGRDVLFGGAGADVFLFRTAADSKTDPTQRDVIRDFQQGVDQIDLSLIDAKPGTAGNQAFIWKDQADFSGVQGQLHWSNVNGDTLIEADINGDKVADFAILLKGTYTLASADFVL